MESLTDATVTNGAGLQIDYETSYLTKQYHHEVHLVFDRITQSSSVDGVCTIAV